MAKPKAPLLGFGALGSFGQELVYDKNRAGPYVRRRVIPADPKTPGQQTSRTLLSQANSFWKPTNPRVKEPWQAAGKAQRLSGYNVFIGRFLRDNRGETDLLKFTFSVGTRNSPLPINEASLVGPDFIRIFIELPSTPDGWTFDRVFLGGVENQDPLTATTYTIFEHRSANPPHRPRLTGLNSATRYQIGTWIKWKLPDQSFAYSVNNIWPGGIMTT